MAFENLDPEEVSRFTAHLDRIFEEHAFICGIHHKADNLRFRTTIVLAGILENSEELTEDNRTRTIDIYRWLDLEGHNRTLLQFSCYSSPEPEVTNYTVTHDEILWGEEPLADNEILVVLDALVRYTTFSEPLSQQLALNEVMQLNVPLLT